MEATRDYDAKTNWARFEHGFLVRRPQQFTGEKVELKIGDKGRITLPTKLLKDLGLREGDVLELDARGRAIILRPRAAPVSKTKGIAGKFEVDLEEVEQAIGKEE